MHAKIVPIERIDIARRLVNDDHLRHAVSPVQAETGRQLTRPVSIRRPDRAARIGRRGIFSGYRFAPGKPAAVIGY
jgi:hypothetical protein